MFEIPSETRKVFRFALIALSVTFLLTLIYSFTPRTCAGIGCSPELNVGRFRFTTPLLILLVVQILGIIGLAVALILIRKQGHESLGSSDAFASLAKSSPIFKVRQVSKQF